jgi:CRP/FNR family transcriptional regulator
MSSEILREGQAILMLGSLRADGRVAAFLLDMLERMKARGFSETEMVLRMTREDLGSFLGLKLETVSRVLAKLSASGLISVDNRHVRVLQRDGLAALAKPQSL